MIFQTECIQCKKIFKTNNSKDKTCSDKCLNDYLDSHRKDSLNDFFKIKANRSCLNCKILFKAENKNKIYCSLRCKLKTWINNNKSKVRCYNRKYMKDYLPNYRKLRAKPLSVVTN